MGKRKEKKKKEKFEDDGRTIANMNVEGFRWYVSEEEKENRKKISASHYTWKERLAMIGGAYRAIFPYLLILIAAIVFVFLFMNAWLA